MKKVMRGVKCQEFLRNGGGFAESGSAKMERQSKAKRVEGGLATGRQGIATTTGRYCTQIV